MEYNDLIGPRPEDAPEKVLDDVTTDGQPLWMAFLEDPDGLTLSKEDVQDAKNAFARAKAEHPDAVEMCQRQPFSECIKSLRNAA